MKSLSNVLRALQCARYIEVLASKNNNVVDVELLPNGTLYCEQLSKQWQRTPTSPDSPIFFSDNTEQPHISSRLAFVHCQNFRANMQLLSTNANGAQCPAVIKSTYHSTTTSATSIDENFYISPTSGSRGHTYLVSDFFFHVAGGLEKFYNIQRERKIWWMRFSANPSRYFLEPYDFTAHNEEFHENCQSITIKARFPFGNTKVEHVTLVPLRESRLENSNDFYVHDNRSGQRILPAVIRSVINLEAAACAMLLDSNDHSRDNTLLLNRKLVPFQCAVACLHKDKASADLRDLHSHISFEIQRAGLRLFDNDANLFTNCKTRLNSELHMADNIGIPYVIIIEEDTLRTGLLKLRNRDTTLEETIHISDIPEYLLNIFTH